MVKTAKPSPTQKGGSQGETLLALMQILRMLRYRRKYVILAVIAGGFLVTQRPLLGRLPAMDCQVICLGADAVKLHACGRSNPSVAVGAE